MTRTVSPRARRTAPNWTSRDLIARVSRRHTNDVWFAEVKDGPTWFGSHLRIDGLAIAKSWSPIRVTGYEVKVDRGDWLRDSKWESYLAMCTDLYVVAPKDVVRIDEMPKGVGLIEAVGEKGLRTARKATHRAITVPSDMLLYLLMSRVRVKDSDYPGMSREARIEQWRDRLASNRAAKEIGWNVSKAVRERIDKLDGAGSGRLVAYEAEVEAFITKHAPHSSRWGGIGDRLESALTSREDTVREMTRVLRGTALRSARLLAAAAKRGGAS